MVFGTRADSNKLRAGMFNQTASAELNALIRDQERERERIGIEIDITRNAANGASGADLPIGPTIFRARINIIAATAAAVPRIAGVQVLAVVVGYPGR